MNKRTSQVAYQTVETRNVVLDQLQEEGQAINTETTQPLLITIKETMKQLRVSRSMMNSLIKREGLPVHRFGRRVLIDPEELRPWLTQRRQAS